MKRYFLLVAAVVVFGASISEVKASEITTPFDSSLAGSTLIDFETFAPPGAFNDMTLYGVNFSTNTKFGYTSNIYSGFYNTSGYSIQNTYAPDAFSTLDFTFMLSPVSAFGFNFGASDTTWTLSAYDAYDNLIETISIPPVYSSNSGDFFGISNSGITHARLSGTPGDYVLIDNFRWAPETASVPEPSTLLLLGSGMVGLGLTRLRKFRKNA